MYELYYWPSIQGPGEAGRGAGVPSIVHFLQGASKKRPPFAPPFLRAGKLIIGQTANILQYVGAEEEGAPQRFKLCISECHGLR